MLAQWAEEGLGLITPTGHRFDLWSFADDLWVMGKTPADLARMLSILQRVLSANGVKLDWDKSAWWTGKFPRQSLSLLFGASIPATLSLSVLGHTVAPSHGDDQLRLVSVRLWRLFWKYAHVFRNKEVRLAKRVRLMLSTMQGLLKWFAPTAKWTPVHDRQLQLLQRRLVRAAMASRRRTGEDWLG